MKIYLANTSLSVLTAVTWSSLTGTATLVYDNTVTPTVGWNIFDVSQLASFSLLSGSNLLVLVETNFGGGGGSGTGSGSAGNGIQYTSTSTQYRHETWTQDNTPSTGNGSLSYNRPNIQLSLGPPPTCLAPTNLSITNLMSSSADINWTASSSAPALGYDYYSSTSNVAPTPSTIPTDSVAAGVTTASLPPLSPNTTYYVWVRSVCSSADKSSWSLISFTTPCVSATVPFFEGFESGYSDGAIVGGCWSQAVGTVYTANSWMINTSQTNYNRTPKTGTANATLKYSGESWLFRPVTLVGGTSYRLSFYARQNTATAANANILASFGTSGTPAAMTNPIIASTNLIDGDYQLIQGDFIPTISGDYYIGIKGYVNSSPWYISLDDIALDLSPTCLPPTALTTSGITPISANVSWTAPSSTPALGYEYYSSTTNVAPTSFTTPTDSVGAGVTTASLPTLTPSTTYYVWVRSVCSLSDKSAWSTSTSFITPCNSTSIPYSAPISATTGTSIPNCMTLETISGNAWKTIATPTGFGGRALQYSYNSSAANSWIFTQGLELTAGISYRLTYQYGNNSTTYTESLRIKYGTSPNEVGMTTLLADHPSIKTSTPLQKTIDFTPTTTGVYYFGFDAYSIANQLSLYLNNISINLSPPNCSGTPNAGTINTATMSICSGTAFTAISSGITLDVTGLSGQWQSSTDGGSNWNDVSGAVDTILNVPQGVVTTATWYRYSLACSYSASVGYSNILEVSMNTFVNCYCTPVSTCTSVKITEVGINSAINSSLATCTAGYSNYTSLGSMTNFQQASTIPIIVKAKLNSIVAYSAGVWIDFDHSGSFDANEYFDYGVSITPTSSGSTFDFSWNINIPLNAMTGLTRMRVRLATGTIANTSSCATSGTGEFEDYLITIDAAPSCSTVNAGTITSTEANISCANTSFTIEATGYTNNMSGLTYQWMDSTQGSPYSAIGASTSTYSNLVINNLSETTSYQLAVSCSYGPTTEVSNPITVNYTPPIILSTIPASICGLGTLNLNATSNPEAEVKWYSAAAGGTPLFTGNTFTTPVLNTSTDYWVSAANGSVAQSLASPIIGTAGFYSASIGWGLRFTVNNTTTINQVTVKAKNSVAGSASMQIKITDLNDVVLYTGVLHNFNVTTVSTEYDIPVNVQVPPGNYKMVMTATGINDLARESTGVTFPYTDPGNNVEITAGANGVGTAQTTSAYYWFYNWEIGNGCESSRQIVTATVTPAPLITASATSTSICEGFSTDLSVSSANGTYTYTWEPGTLTGGDQTVSPLSTTTYIVNAIDNSGGLNSGCAATSSITVAVLPIPSAVIVTPNNEIACLGAVTQLIASGGSLSNISILNEDFNGSTNNWTTINNTTGGTPANVDWTLRSDGYDNYHSNDNSQFFLTDANDGGSGTIAQTILQSPAFSTQNFTSASVNFHHYLKVGSGNYSDSGKVQASIDGTNWTDLQTYKGTDVGAPTSFANADVSLTGNFLDQPIVYIRFLFEGGWGYYWALDNVKIDGIQTTSISWSPTTDLYTDAGATTAYTGGAVTTVYAKSSTIGSISYIATATGANLCSNSSTAATIQTQQAAVIASAITTQPTTCQATDGEITLSGTFPESTTTVSFMRNGISDSRIVTGTNVEMKLSNLNAGSYSDIVVSEDFCASNNWGQIVLNDGISIGTIAGSNSSEGDDQGSGSIVNYANVSCELIATVNATNGDLGAVTADVSLLTGDQTFNNQPYISRVYDIEATNNVGGTLTLYFSDAEINAYNNAVNTIGNPAYPLIGPNGENFQITAFHSSAPGTGPQGYDTTGMEVLLPSSIIHNGGVWAVTFSTTSFSGFFAHSNLENAPLPIKLAAISAVNLGKTNRVDWNTATEDEGEVFFIERSADGKSFKEIGTTQAKGIVNTRYNFLDVSPITGVNYYRLRMVNIDGSKAYSKIVNATMNASEFRMNAFPNPTDGMVTVRIYGIVAENAQLTITDATGRTIQNYKVTGETFEVNMKNLAVGMYIIKYTDDTRTAVLKVDKQ